MTIWERVYRALGGGAPGEGDFRNWMENPPPCLALFEWLRALGFLKRDCTLPESEQGWIVNFKWQWRFWRGPYYDCLEARGMIPRGTGLTGIADRIREIRR